MTTTDQTRFGDVEQTEAGAWRLRFTRVLPHPLEKVWQAITEAGHLEHWFPTTIEGERRAGAPLRFSFPENRFPAFEGEMLAYEPETMMEFRWGPDVVRIELRSVPGGTELSLLDTLEERGKAARDSAGWHTCLDALEASLGGDAKAREQLSRPDWGELHARYAQSFGPEAATIGPPE